MSLRDIKGNLIESVYQLPDGRSLHRFNWRSNSTGDLNWNEVSLEGEAEYIDYVSNSGSGTVELFLYDELDRDALEGRVAGTTYQMTIGTPGRRWLSQTFTHDGATFTRGLRLTGLHRFVLDGSASAEASGVIDLVMRR